jgi:hypothetical protein
MEENSCIHLLLINISTIISTIKDAENIYICKKTRKKNLLRKMTRHFSCITNMKAVSTKEALFNVIPRIQCRMSHHNMTLCSQSKIHSIDSNMGLHCFLLETMEMQPLIIQT